MKKVKIGFLLSHPIQYFSPLLKKLAKEEWCDLVVYYCSNESVKIFKDEGFGRKIAWDVPLLEGYFYKFLKNLSFMPGVSKGFWGLVNPSLFKHIKKDKIDILIVHGWNYFTHTLGIVGSKFLNYKVFLRGESPLNQEKLKPSWKIFFKKLLLQNFLFRLVDAFLVIGRENENFYKFYGQPKKKFFFTPYCVDNDFFKGRRLSSHERKKWRAKLGIAEKVVILFVGKLIEKKRPFDLLYAYEKLSFSVKEKSILLFVGDGVLRKKLEEYSKNKGLRVIFLGFKNQTELPIFYSISDIFVLPSGIGETWGLAVNEAMNFELPVIVSDIVGCSSDLVKHGKNGFIFKCGNVSQLSEYLERLVTDETLRKKFGKESLRILEIYCYEEVIKGIKEAVNKLVAGGEK